MKRLTYIAAFLLTIVTIAVSSCSSGPRREPGRVYMPDMAYSRAYESYALRDSTQFTIDATNANHKIFYNAMPVKGSIKRGELPTFNVPNDSNGLLNLSAQVKSPLATLNKVEIDEAARLFNINCAVCHGAKAEANGPVAAKIGGVKSIIAASPGYSDGRLFYVMTYGQNNMGSYASQLTKKQRWMIVQYIRSLEPKKESTSTSLTTSTTIKKVDSVTVAKK